MNRTEALTEVLRDPTRSEKERDVARAALARTHADATDAARNELLQLSSKPLPEIAYHDIHTFCSERGWRNTRDVYEQWLQARFNTDSGRPDLLRAAEYLRAHDLNEWDGGLRDWRDSGFKSAARLISALEVIASSPERGNYHDRATVEACKQFLAEIQRGSAQ
jgi:hypothetical protein